MSKRRRRFSPEYKLRVAFDLAISSQGKLLDRQGFSKVKPASLSGGSSGKEQMQNVLSPAMELSVP
jgi:hypothetical protein